MKWTNDTFSPRPPLVFEEESIFGLKFQHSSKIFVRIIVQRARLSWMTFFMERIVFIIEFTAAAIKCYLIWKRDPCQTPGITAKGHSYFDIHPTLFCLPFLRGLLSAAKCVNPLNIFIILFYLLRPTKMQSAR